MGPHEDWVGPWDAPGAPGKFQIDINGKTLAKELGVTGKDWQWDEAGSVN